MLRRNCCYSRTDQQISYQTVLVQTSSHDLWNPDEEMNQNYWACYPWKILTRNQNWK
jgi:hypothetical protein